MYFYHFYQEGRVAGRMSEVCPFIKDIEVGIENFSGPWSDPGITSGPIPDIESYLP